MWRGEAAVAGDYVGGDGGKFCLRSEYICLLGRMLKSVFPQQRSSRRKVSMLL